MPASRHGCRADVRPGRAYTRGHVPARPTAAPEPVALVTLFASRVTSAPAALHSLSRVPLPFLPGLVCCRILEPCGLELARFGLLEAWSGCVRPGQGQSTGAQAVRGGACHLHCPGRPLGCARPLLVRAGILLPLTCASLLALGAQRGRGTCLRPISHAPGSRALRPRDYSWPVTLSA